MLCPSIKRCLRLVTVDAGDGYIRIPSAFVYVHECVGYRGELKGPRTAERWTKRAGVPAAGPAPDTAPGTKETPNTCRMGTAVPTPSGVVISQSLEISERTVWGSGRGWAVFGK